MTHAPGVNVLETERLVLLRFTLDDAQFVTELVDAPGWLRFIGDRDVHTPEQACTFIEKRLLGPYARLGFGCYRVELKRDGSPIGLCGLVRRDGLDDVDIGFGLPERCAGQVYAYEAAVGAVRYAREELARLCAITRPDNQRSIALLEKLGMRFERALRLPGEQTDLSLYGLGLGAP